MQEAWANDYRGLEVSALAHEGMASEARRQAFELNRFADQKEGVAIALREEMGRIAEALTQGEDDGRE